MTPGQHSGRKLTQTNINKQTSFVEAVNYSLVRSIPSHLEDVSQSDANFSQTLNPFVILSIENTAFVCNMLAQTNINLEANDEYL